MLNLIYPAAMRHYLQWFDEAFAHYNGPRPRAMYHDSYEYKSDWPPTSSPLSSNAAATASKPNSPPFSATNHATRNT